MKKIPKGFKWNKVKVKPTIQPPVNYKIIPLDGTKLADCKITISCRVCGRPAHLPLGKCLEKFLTNTKKYKCK